MIGKALKPLAKIKKKAWSAMGNAFGQIRKSVDPMQSFSKILEIVNILMLPLTYIMTILAYVILKNLMPYIGDLILLLADLEGALNDVGEAAAAAIISLEAYEPWFTAYFAWWDQFHYDLGMLWINSLNYIFGLVEDFFEWIEAIIPGGDGGGGGGGGEGPGFDWPIIPTPNPIGPPGYSPLSSSTSNTVNINLQGSIIDDRDKLIRDIVEQVVIRL